MLLSSVVLVTVQLQFLYMGIGNAAFLPSIHSRQDPGNSGQGICLTAGCVKAAAVILNSIDDTVNPCDDFYEFACGGWDDSHTIPEDKPGVSVFQDLEDDLNIKLRALLDKPVDDQQPDFVKTVKAMYESCTNVSTIETLQGEPLKKALDSIGGWPVVLGENWDKSKFDWIDMLIKLRNMGYSYDNLMYLSVSTDFRNNTQHIIELDQASLGMPDESYYKKEFNDSVVSAYFELMVKSATKLGASEANARKELLEVFQFETALANYSLPMEERRNFSQMYNKYTVKQLREMTPEIDWMKYFNGLLNDPITENEPVIVGVPSFVRNFSKLISTTDKRVVANYLVWRVVSTSIKWLSKSWRQLSKDYVEALQGTSQEAPRWESCLSKLRDSLPVALGSYYVRHHFKEESKTAAMQMVEYIQKEFQEILKGVEWMDEKTRGKAIEKAKAIEPYIGYPKELLDDKIVSNYYSALSLDEKSYFDNNLKISKFSTDRYFSMLRKPNVKEDWTKHANAAVVNAFYNPVENIIEFPAGILQKNFFSRDRPQYMNFGGIGWVIGHEITHGFDDQGRQFDKDGNNVNWWDEKTDELFKEKAQCIIDQYGNFTDPDAEMNLNGVNSQGENIADNGGLKAAYKAYQSWAADKGQELKLPGLKYNQRQMFWISAANIWCGKYKPEFMKLWISTGVHSPGRFRVIGPLSNIAEFSTDFECPPGSKMNPDHKCRVW